MTLSFIKHEVRRATISLSLLIAALMTGLHPFTAVAEVAAKRFPVTTEMVVSAMRYRQLSVDGVQVSLAAPITASTDNPMLDIQTVTQTSPRSAQLRVVCRNRTQCLPFYVAVAWPEATSGVVLAKPPYQAEQPKSAEKLGKDTSIVAMRAGSPATLLIEDEKVHIRLRVVCLQAGTAGDKVRVSTPDHKVAYKAEIVAPNLLKGSF